MLKQETRFDVDGVTIRGYFHLPEGSKGQVPLIVMFNGYATEWGFGTEGFIKAFTDNGFATLNFDYRCFGSSDGEPRQLVDIPAQLDDCRASIRHALAQPWVDGARLAIWGSSLGGGHAISMAAEFPQVKAMVAQVPHCDSREAMKVVKLSAIAKGMGLAMADSIGAVFNARIIRIPVVAEPHDYGVMNHAGWKTNYLHIANTGGTWANAIPARSLLRGGDYRPAMVADKIACPVLLVAAEKDAGVPMESVWQTSSKIANCEYYSFLGDHFDVYYGDFFEAVLAKELSFFNKVL